MNYNKDNTKEFEGKLVRIKSIVKDYPGDRIVTIKSVGETGITYTIFGINKEFFTLYENIRLILDP